MTFLTAHLPFPESSSTSSSSKSTTLPTARTTAALSALPPPGTHLVISDTLNSPAHFVLHHLVSAAVVLKRPVVWVDFRAEGRASWESVLRKLGTPLPANNQPLSGESLPPLTHITPTCLPSLSHSHPFSPSIINETHSIDLKPTYDTISSVLSFATPSSTPPVIILDGLTELVNIGASPEYTARFVQAVHALSRKSKSFLISTLHTDQLPLALNHPIPRPTDDPTTDLLGKLTQLGPGGWWRVSNLVSGRSGDVHGEISSHPFPSPTPHPFPPGSGTNTVSSFTTTTPSPGSTHTSPFPNIPRSHPLQYRLESNTVKVFPKGTGRGFL